jgi:glycosyltransferase involved in cell wall biosynthesis
MKIGYVMQQGAEIRHPPFDGPANHVREVVEALESLGHSVRVLIRLDRQIWKADGLRNFQLVEVSPLDRDPLRLLERGVRRIRSQFRLPYAGLFESMRFALACRRELQEVDLLFERLTRMSYGGGLAARWLRRPLILEYNGDPLPDLEAKGMARQGFQKWLSVSLLRWTIRQAAHVVVGGDGWRRQFLQQWGVAPDKVTTIENGTVLVRLLQREQLRVFDSNSNAERDLSLVYLGGFYPSHGVQILLRALARLRERGLSLRLLLIGTGFGLEEARQLVKQHELNQHVIFTGQLAARDFAPYLSQADIGLSPYCGWKEYSGLKLFDYKAAGLAIIASGENGQPATLEHGKTGWIVPPCDEEALTAAIWQLVTEPDLRRSLGQAARLDAERYHSWENTARHLEQVFQETLGQVN